MGLWRACSRCQHFCAVDCGSLYVYGCGLVSWEAIIKDGSVQLSPSSAGPSSVTTPGLSFKCPLGHLFHHDSEPRIEGETYDEILVTAQPTGPCGPTENELELYSWYEPSFQFWC